MMQVMRQNMKVILWILVLAFIATIVFSWGMGGFQGSGPKQGVVATINGVEISLERFEDAIQQRYEYERSQQEEDLNEYQVRAVRTEVWDEMVRSILIEQEVKKLGIKVSDREIAYMVQNNPPEWIRQAEVFLTDGMFDIEKYHEFLRNPAAARDVIFIEQSYRENLPNQKFINRILALANVSDQEAWQKYVDDNLKGRAKYVLFETGNVELDSSSVTDKEVADYYFAHRDDYLVPEKRRIIYVMFSEEPSSEDSAAVLDLAEELMEEIRSGGDFAELAKLYSEDRSGENGGDLGYFERGRMVPEFEEAAFSTKVGEVTGPVQSQFGYHLIKVTDKKREDGVEKVKASHILLKIQPSADTRDLIRATVTGFAEDIQEADFYASADVYGVKVDTSAYFEKQDVIPAIGRLPAAVDFIFNRPIGESGPAYPVRDGWLIFKSLDKQKEHTLTLDDVHDQIYADLYKDKKIAKTAGLARDFYSSIESADQFETKAAGATLEVTEIEHPFKFDAYIRGVGRDPEFTAAALKLDLNEISEPVKCQKGYYVIQLIEKTEVDSAKFLEKKDELRQQILNQKQNQYYALWLEDAKEKADIEDYRYLYYRDY